MARDFRQFPLVTLTVDDDPDLLTVLKLTLERSGFQVWQANSGTQALSVLAERGLPDIAIVDMNMPEMGGIEFCRAVLDYSDLPILMLTAVQDTSVIVHVLTQIAEDYLIKPFRAPELVARIHRVLDRLGKLPFPPGRFVPVHPALEIDFVGQCVRVNDQLVDITPLESRLLYIFTRQAGQVLAPAYLTRRLWPRELSSDDRIRVTIHRLRQKIEPEDNSLTFLVTERGDGYRFLD